MKHDPRAAAPPSPPESFKTTDTWIQETPWGTSLRPARGPGEADEKEQREREHQIGREVRAKGRKVAGIPPRVLPLLDALQESEPVAAVRRFMADEAHCLLFVAGGPGCGKTVAACLGLDLGITIEMQGLCANHRGAGEFLKAMDLLRIDTFDAEAWGELRKVPVLVIDDLGAEPLDEKGWGLSKVAGLIDARYDECRKTIVTTNLTAAQFKARYADGGRLADRIREAGSFVEFAGKSLRHPPGAAGAPPTAPTTTEGNHHVR